MVKDRIFTIADLPEITRQLLHDDQERLVALYRIKRSLPSGAEECLLIQQAETRILVRAGAKRSLLNHLLAHHFDSSS